MSEGDFYLVVGNLCGVVSGCSIIFSRSVVTSVTLMHHIYTRLKSNAIFSKEEFSRTIARMLFRSLHVC